jgi:hypothetical protein
LLRLKGKHCEVWIGSDTHDKHPLVVEVFFFNQERKRWEYDYVRLSEEALREFLSRRKGGE